MQILIWSLQEQTEIKQRTPLSPIPLEKGADRRILNQVNHLQHRKV